MSWPQLVKISTQCSTIAQVGFLPSDWGTRRLAGQSSPDVWGQEVWGQTGSGQMWLHRYTAHTPENWIKWGKLGLMKRIGLNGKNWVKWWKLGLMKKIGSNGENWNKWWKLVKINIGLNDNWIEWKLDWMKIALNENWIKWKLGQMNIWLNENWIEWKTCQMKIWLNCNLKLSDMPSGNTWLNACELSVAPD